MKKLAFFVEGLTEQLFIKELLIEIAGAKNIEIDEVKFSNEADKTDLLQIIAKSETDKKYYVLIVNCSNDERVQSAVIDNHASLVKKGYSKILGLRDLYPKTHTEIPSVERAIKYYVPTKPIPTHILLAVAEIEAWFMAEHNHYEKIDKKLTHALIKSNLLHDVHTDDLELVPHPAEELNKIYQLVGKKYTKKAASISKTVKALDYGHMYAGLISRVKYLKNLIQHIEDFLS